MNTVIISLADKAWEFLQPVLTWDMALENFCFVVGMGLGIWWMFWPDNAFWKWMAVDKGFDSRKLSRAFASQMFSFPLAVLPEYFELYTGIELPLLLEIAALLPMVLIYILIGILGRAKKLH